MHRELEEEEEAVPVEEEAGISDGSTAVSRARKLLFRRMLVGIKDGRFFLGSFYCIDKQGNIILQDAVEYRCTRQSSPFPMEQRCLGLILIPSSCRSTCHIGSSLHEHIISTATAVDCYNE
ncbi:unnamed protein product [Sphenostylis stenocarpa]|uniref:Sm domain-containing protein n=1 Tax=Sphenostylis stenocarpa TaxID=92480 RepID=A0AA86T3G4_9FABA|nr:unnamed protein product [Sphenostylis stenocarpa]